MKQLQVSTPGYLEKLVSVTQSLTQQEWQDATAQLDELLQEVPAYDAINTICARSLRERNQLEAPMYLRNLEDSDKQINVFDLILKSVPPVQVVSSIALQKMLHLYSSGVASFTHLNIGIGKGRFEFKLLEELSKLSADKMPHLIRIIGVDIDEASLRETGEGIQKIANTLFPPTTTIEYVPVFAFAESITTDTWEMIRDHSTEALGVISAFTLHHMPTADQRQEVLHQISACDPELFMLLEPDVDHFTTDLAARLVNCWNLFGSIFQMVDENCADEDERDAIKYKFFGREIEDILGNEEKKRSEKHEKADVWAKRLKKADFRLHQVPENMLAGGNSFQDMKIVSSPEHGYTTTVYKDVPLVAIFTSSKKK